MLELNRKIFRHLQNLWSPTAANSAGSIADLKVQLKASDSEPRVRLSWPPVRGSAADNVSYDVRLRRSHKTGKTKTEVLRTEDEEIEIPFPDEGVEVALRNRIGRKVTPWSSSAMLISRTGEAEPSILVLVQGDQPATSDLDLLKAPGALNVREVDDKQIELTWNEPTFKFGGLVYQVRVGRRKPDGEFVAEFNRSEEPRLRIPLKVGALRVSVRMMHPLAPVLKGPFSASVRVARGVRPDDPGKTLLRSIDETKPEEYHSNLAAIAEAIRSKKTELGSFPMALSLILEGRGCNFKCFYCSHILPDSYLEVSKADTLARGDVFKDVESFRAPYVSRETVGTPSAMVEDVIANLPKLTTVMFGGSEPLLYPEFEEVVKRLREVDHIQCSVCTNGSLLNAELAEHITNANFPWVRVSIDGASPETFKKIRKGKFEKVINNIRHLIALRDAKCMETPRVQFNFVVCRSNYHEIPDLIRLAKEIGVSQINYKMLISPKSSEWAPIFDGEDPLADIGLCVEILDLMDDAEALASELDVRLTKEAVRPAIYTVHPGLCDPEARKEVREKFDADIRARQAERLKSVRDLNGPKSLADHVKDSGVAHQLNTNRKKPGSSAPVSSSTSSETEDLSRLVDEEDGTGEAPAEAVHVDWPKVFCDQPFTNLSVGHHRAKFCCYALGYYTKSIAGDSLALSEIWNNDRFQEARQHMLEGRADLVCKPTCPHLVHGGLKSAAVRSKEKLAKNKKAQEPSEAPAWGKQDNSDAVYPACKVVAVGAETDSSKTSP